jgi:RNA polymerase sigma-70 factor (ECF subfamily)
MDDAAIVALFWARSEDALREAESRYGAYCASVAGRILANPEDTRECLNDLWLAVWRSIPPQCPENLRTYLGKLARNLAVSRWREARRQKRGGGEAALVLEELAAGEALRYPSFGWLFRGASGSRWRRGPARRMARRLSAL